MGTFPNGNVSKPWCVSEYRPPPEGIRPCHHANSSPHWPSPPPRSARSRPVRAAARAAKTITVAYQKFGTFIQMDQHMQKVKTEFEKANPGDRQAGADRGRRERLLHQAGPHEPVRHRPRPTSSTRTPSWSTPTSAPATWRRSTTTSRSGRTGASSPTPAKAAGQGRWTARPTASRWAPTPAASTTTSRSSPRPACPTDWQPKTWNDVLTAARTIKAKVPGVTPLNVYSGKGAGEGATMQGFEMLLYGTRTRCTTPRRRSGSRRARASPTR